MTSFPYRIDWTPELMKQSAAKIRTDTFGGYVWPKEKRRHHPNDENRVQPTAPCVRCGIPRVVRSGRPNVCADCRYVLSPAEYAQWAA